MAKRLIGITGGYRQRKLDGDEEFYLNAKYFDAVELAGGVPVPLPPCREDRTLKAMLRGLHGLIISGGPDTPPARYGQEPHPKTAPVHARRDDFDFRCLRAALEESLPILAICYGCQLLNIFLGGTLIQDIPSQRPMAEDHAPDAPALHHVRIEPGSKLAAWVGVTELEACSSHHQAVDRLGGGLRIVARSPEGIVEGIETNDGRPIVGVQWHPERLTDRPEHLALFQALVQHARRIS